MTRSPISGPILSAGSAVASATRPSSSGSSWVTVSSAIASSTGRPSPLSAQRRMTMRPSAPRTLPDATKCVVTPAGTNATVLKPPDLSSPTGGAKRGARSGSDRISTRGRSTKPTARISPLGENSTENGRPAPASLWRTISLPSGS